MYATAAVVTENSGIKLKSTAFMEKRIEKEITRMRGDLPLLTELQLLTELWKDNGISDRKKRKILRRYDVKDEGDIDVEKERMNQKIQAKAQRIKGLRKGANS